MPATLTQISPTVEAATAALQRGEFVSIYDADRREEETDLVIASEFVTPQAIRTLRTAAGGLICTTLSAPVHEGLGLPLLHDLLRESGTRYPVLNALTDARIPYEPQATKPSFGLSVNHRETFTGITDNDRAVTVTRLAAVARECRPGREARAQERFGREFRAPGHVFLLNARPGLLRERRGHTELATALLELAGLTPTATICEMMNGPSGRALPKADAIKYAAQNDLTFLEGHEVVTAWTRWSETRTNPPRRLP